jgi:LuxR family transcriptional regulator, maltose regulon positive regulatory protein
MTKTIPVVQAGLVVDDQTSGPAIHLDTPAWFAWLETPTTTRFSYALFNRTRGYIDGFMTVRKEQRQRGTAYWSVYRRQGQRLRKLYIGPSAALTHARLEQIAVLLRPRDGPPKNPTLFSRQATRPSQPTSRERLLLI